MKAVLLRAYGGPEALDYEDAPDPTPGPGEVLVRVLSSSINPIDFKLRSGAMKDLMPLTFPAILGHDVAGEVVALGSGVIQFKIGDNVMGFTNNAYAGLVASPASVFCLIPDGLAVTEAGPLPLVLLTGAQLIEKGLPALRGQRVLITGALGSVGRTAVHVAKQHGAIVIAGVRASQRAEAASLGANEILAVDDDLEVAALAPLDAIADTVNGAAIAKLIPKLKPGSALASVLGKPKGAEGAHIAVHVIFAQPDPPRLAQLAAEVRDGHFQIPVVRYFPLSEIQDAHRAAEHSPGGKIELHP